MVWCDRGRWYCLRAVALGVYQYPKKDRCHHGEEEELYKERSAQYAHGGTGNPRWGEILELVNTDNPGNWRLAVIEADVMLDDLMKRLGYLGDTLGERLRSADSATFRSLQEAWEAHRVRNQIAHEGSDFVLTQREARRIIDLFRQVFQEHGVI